MTFNSPRDAGVARLMDSGARLLGGGVATSRCAAPRGVSRVDRRWRAQNAVAPAIERDLAGNCCAKVVTDDGTMDG